MPRLARYLLPVLLSALALSPARADERPKSRTFRFSYAATVTGLKPGEKARVWLPVAPSNADQDVTLLDKAVPPGSTIGTEPQYGNRVLYAEAAPDAEGKVSLKVVYRITRREVRGEAGPEMEEDAAALARYLKSDAMVPVGGKCLELLKGKELPRDQTQAARVLYDVVNGHMRYSKDGAGWGRGDAVWACESGFGNCTDFHSLFIALARAQKIPAKFEIGFPLPEQRGAGRVAGYHCWAYFRPRGKGWVPVDISEANKNPKLRDYYFGNLTADRVTFSTGRDLTLVPKQDGPPLNFFVYPHVEVGGQPYPRDRVQTAFTYQDE